PHGRPRSEHAAVTGLRHESGTEQFLDGDAGILRALDLACEVFYRPDRVLVREQVEHAPFGLIHPASRGTGILGLHGSFASCATAPGQFALSLGPTCMDGIEARLPWRWGQAVSLRVSLDPPSQSLPAVLRRSVHSTSMCAS